MTDGMDERGEREAFEGADDARETRIPAGTVDVVSTQTQELPDLAAEDAELTALDEQEILDLNRRFSSVRRSVGALEKVLLQGPR